jgi:hypothetical protein
MKLTITSGKTPDINVSVNSTDVLVGTPSNVLVEVTPTPKQVINIDRGIIGPTGATGATGATGPQGPSGEGAPVGGTTGQVIAKKSNVNYDTQWITLATVANTGSYTDLINKPTIPNAQVNSDWNAVSGIAQILNKPTLATVATSGSYNDLSSKPSLGTIASQNSNSISITGGSISGTTVSGYIATTQKGAANGVATLDSGGQIPIGQIPPLGDLNYQGTWNAASNSPTLTSNIGTKGYYYVVNFAGNTDLNGITDWQVNDWAVFNGSVWQKIDNTDTVSSVNGYTGAVVLTYTDVNAQIAGTYVNSVSATSPIASSGGTTPTISISKASATINGYLSSTDWSTFNAKGSGTVTSVSGTTGRITSTGGNTPILDLTSGIVSAGTTGSSTLIPVITVDTYGRVTSITTASNPQGTVTSVSGTAPIASTGGATPTISISQASASTNGYLSSTDWSTFNSKGSGTVTSVSATAGTGISISGSPITSSGTLTITNTAPDQTVALNAGTGISVSGTYPNFTITNTNSSSGTVTNIATGTGLSGGPITTTGTISFSNSNVATWAATPSSANLASAVTDETGSGSLVFNTSPVLQTPTLSGATVDNTSPYMTFAATTSPTYTAGRLWYDSTQSALAYYNDVTNNTIHIGQEIQLECYNQSGATITAGSAVYINGTHSHQPQIVLAQANTLASSQVIGVANQDIPNNSNGYVVIIGFVSGINTSAYTAGDTLYLSATTAGALTNVQPNTPNYAVRVGYVTYVNPSQGTIEISKSNVFSLATNIITPLSTKTSAYTLTSTDSTILGNATSAGFTLTLPTAVGTTGKTYVIKKIDSSTNAVTIGTTSSQTIDGNTTYALSNQWGGVTLQSDGSNWLIIGNIFGRNGTTGTF